LVLDTNDPKKESTVKKFKAKDNLIVEGRSVVVLCHKEE
jgi:hypothetical protein